MGHLGHLGHLSNISYLRRPMKVIPLRRAWDMAMVFPGKAAHPGVGPRMRPRPGKISSRSTAAVNPLFFDSKRLWIIPPKGTEGVKMLCTWSDVAVLMTLVMLFHFMRKAVVVKLPSYPAPRFFYFFRQTLLCRKPLEWGCFPRGVLFHAGFEEWALKFCFFKFFQPNVQEMRFFRRGCTKAGESQKTDGCSLVRGLLRPTPIPPAPPEKAARAETAQSGAKGKASKHKAQRANTPTANSMLGNSLIKTNF